MAKAKTSHDKTIRIACEGASTVAMEDLIPFQGNLKTLSEASYQKLRALILKLGFSFPVQAWKHKDKIFIIDAHQRMNVLQRLRDEEGYEIPPLPVVWIEAGTRQEAAEKLLAGVSQFGEITSEGLFEYMNEFKIEMPMLETQFQFPEINFDRFSKTFFPEEVEVSFTTKARPPGEETNKEEQPEDDHSCPKCGYSW